MDVLSNLVRSLAIIMILGSLLEMFLPSGELKKFVQVIIGLFILVTVLNPLLSLFNQNWSSSLQAWSNTNQGVALEEILAQGNQLKASNDAQALSQYKQKLAEQITGVVNLSGEVKVEKAVVKVDEQEGVLGEIEQVQLSVVPAAGPPNQAGKETALVQPVVIDLKQGQSTKVSKPVKKMVSAQSIENLRNSLANLYGINPAKIVINQVN